jgi:hypothetical protein
MRSARPSQAIDFEGVYVVHDNRRPVIVIVDFDPHIAEIE